MYFFFYVETTYSGVFHKPGTSQFADAIIARIIVGVALVFRFRIGNNEQQQKGLDYSHLHSTVSTTSKSKLKPVSSRSFLYKNERRRKHHTYNKPDKQIIGKVVTLIYK